MREMLRRIEKVDWLPLFSFAKCPRGSHRRRNFLPPEVMQWTPVRTATGDPVERIDAEFCRISQQEPHEQVQCVIIRGIPAETVIVGMGAIETVVDDILK